MAKRAKMSSEAPDNAKTTAETAVPARYEPDTARDSIMGRPLHMAEHVLAQPSSLRARPHPIRHAAAMAYGQPSAISPKEWASIRAFPANAAARPASNAILPLPEPVARPKNAAHTSIVTEYAMKKRRPKDSPAPWASPISWRNTL